MSWPGGADISLYTNSTIDLCCVLLVWAFWMCTDAEIATDFNYLHFRDKIWSCADALSIQPHVRDLQRLVFWSREYEDYCVDGVYHRWTKVHLILKYLWVVNNNIINTMWWPQWFMRSCDIVGSSQFLWRRIGPLSVSRKQTGDHHYRWKHQRFFRCAVDTIRGQSSGGLLIKTKTYWPWAITKSVFCAWSLGD